MKKIFITFAILSLLFACKHIQKVNFDFASQEERQALLVKLTDSIINPMAIGYLQHDSPMNWGSYAWATAYVQDTSMQNYKVLHKALNYYSNLSKNELQLLLQATYSCFPTQFTTEIAAIAQNETENEKIFATAVNYLAGNNIPIQNLLDTHFADSHHPVIEALHNQYLREYHPISISQLALLFEHNRRSGNKTLYSFQHNDRNKVGKVIIQYENNTFAKDGKRLWMADQLARSITNMPMYISNGNTPTGLYKIDTLQSSANKFIGPTPAFVSYLPFEADASMFFKDKKQTYSLENYLSFFPKEWHSNTLLQQAYWAGKAGRGEIHFHGTTIDPDLYKGSPYYPQTPSMGCLSTKEIWDQAGNLTLSDQQVLVDKWLATPSQSGYAYVLEIDERDWDDFENKLNEIINKQ